MKANGCICEREIERERERERERTRENKVQRVLNIWSVRTIRTLEKRTVSTNGSCTAEQVI